MVSYLVVFFLIEGQASIKYLKKFSTRFYDFKPYPVQRDRD